MLKISLLGYGNVGKQIHKICLQKGIAIHQIVSNHALGDNVIRDSSQLQPDTDLLVIAVKDTDIAMVAQQIPYTHIPIIHTSGTVPSTVLNRHECYGVWYPVQTFAPETDICWDDLPVCIYTINANMEKLLALFTNTLGAKAHRVDDTQRKYLHLAAVFANNFSNHILGYADIIMQNNNLPKEILWPLINNTANNFLKAHPHDIQTGPAIRRDMDTIASHQSLLQLADMHEAAEIYDYMTKKIIEKGMPR